MNSIIPVDKVFPDELMERIYNEIDHVPWHYGWPSNKGMGYSHWNYDFAGAGPDNGLDCSTNLSGVIDEAWKFLKQNVVGDQTLLRCYTNSHTFGVEGYPHTDSSRPGDKTIVVYINKRWRREWGGETMIYNGYKIAHAELPNYNHGLIFNGADLHCARSLSRICPEQRITLMFKFCPHNVDLQRDKIQILLMALGANKIKHSLNHLQGHLLRTYDALRAHGFDEVTCAAGGLHSIFGTNIFTHQTLKAEHRDVVVRVIGEEATQLVELFRDIKRPGTLESALANHNTRVEMNDDTARFISQDQINKLCAIEAINLKDQDCLNKYPHLSRVLKGTNTNAKA